MLLLPLTRSSLTLTVMTYNMGNNLCQLPESLSSHLPASDVVFVTTQETEPLKPRRTEGHRSVSLRRSVIRMCAGFRPVAIHSIGGIQSIVMVREGVAVEAVRVADVSVGVGGVVNNKGAIRVKVTPKGRGGNKGGKGKTMSIHLIGSHLAAHSENVSSRNENYGTIWGTFSPDVDEGIGDVVVWAGDLNYRIEHENFDYVAGVVKGYYKGEGIADYDRDLKSASLGTSRYAELAKLDQLNKVRFLRSRGAPSEYAPWENFNEGEINFPPTYKLSKVPSRGSLRSGRDYDKKKGRVPSYTDRVLWRGKGVKCEFYDRVSNGCASDHDPVVAVFKIDC